MANISSVNLLLLKVSKHIYVLMSARESANAEAVSLKSLAEMAVALLVVKAG